MRNEQTQLPDPTNRFFVGVRGGAEIVIQRPPHRPITREEALNLAAYLLVMVECMDLGSTRDTAADFDALRAAIEAT